MAMSAGPLFCPVYTVHKVREAKVNVGDRQERLRLGRWQLWGRGVQVPCGCE